MNIIRKLHKWLSIIIVLQVIIWLISGLYLNIADHQEISGKTYYQPLPSYQYQQNQQLMPIKKIVQDIPKVVEISIIELLGHVYYRISIEKALYLHFPNHYQLVNAITGKVVTLNKQQIIQLAQQSYTGNGNVIATTLIERRPEGYLKQQNPTWRVDFDDIQATSVYIEAESGRLIGHNNNDKRFADFMLMLHFMDYQKQGGFNHWLIIFMAILTLGQALTGAIWLIQWYSTYLRRRVCC